MTRRQPRGPQLTIMWWGDIPNHVIARAGVQSHRITLSPRFHRAIQRATTGGGQAGSTAYNAGWRRTTRPCSPHLVAEAVGEAAALEAGFDAGDLDRVVRATRRTRSAALPTYESATL